MTTTYRDDLGHYLWITLKRDERRPYTTWDAIHEVYLSPKSRGERGKVARILRDFQAERTARA